MSKKHAEPSDAGDPLQPQLRTDAEARLGSAPTPTTARSAAELLHELQVHQIEVEMQNEELRRVQTALEESRDRYLDLYEFAPVGYLSLTADRQIAEINLTGATLLGGERATLLQQRFDHFVAEEDRDRWYLLFTSVMGSANGRGGIELKLQDGADVATHVHLDCLCAKPNGAAPEMRVTMTDISAMALNKQLLAARDELREQLLFQSALLESIPVSMFWKDVEGRYLGCNRAYEEMLGKSRSDVIGKSVFDMAPPEIAEKYHAMDMELFRQPGSQVYEWLIQKPSGEIRNVMFHKATFLHGDGVLGGLIGAMVDITELKQKDAALEESEAHMRAATATARDAIVVIEGEHGTITEWNPAAEAMFGYASADALGRGLHDLLAPLRFRETARHAMAHFAASGEGSAVGKTLELAALHKDGTEFPIELSLSAMQIHGKWHATGIARDITERQRLEQERLVHLRFVESMGRINRAMQGASDLDQMLRNVLDVVLAIFDCDRAWLIHPCDPAAAWWSVPMERTKPDYPGANARGLEIPMEPEIQRVLRTLRATDGPVVFGPGTEHALPEWLREQFGVQSQLTLAVYPGTGQPWAFGMHQCSYARVWTLEEQRLFQEVARRLADGLTSLLSRRDLQESEAKYRRLVDTASEGIWVLGPDTLTTFVNARMGEMLGYSDEEMKGRAQTDFMFEEDAPDHSRILENRRQGLSESYERRFHHKNGGTVWTQVSGTAIFDDDHRFNGIFGMFSDITERKRAEAAFQQVSRHNEMILEAAGEGIWGVDGDGHISFINPAALAMLGYQKDELLGLNSHAAVHHSKPDGSPYREEDCPMHQSLLAGLSVRGKEEILWRKDGSALPVLYSSTPTREDDKVTGAVVTFQDITELKRYQTQLERQSSYDDLTGLPNRNLLADRLAYAVARCLREQKKLAVLVLNLDRFGEINDSLGRAVGDGILRETAERLRQLVREMDMVARSAGDEFVLVGEVAAEEEAAFLARRILESLAQPFRVEERELSLYASVGIGVLPRDGANGETLLNNAQVAMFRTKASGGNNFLFYSAEMNAHTLEHLNLENDLRRAIERDELLLYYQPQLSLRSGEIIGMEALLRWRHPVRGLVSPMEFIPLAETTGLIVPIGEWVLRTACAQNQAWRAAGLRAVPVAVNLSARQFEAQDIVALTAKVLSETGLAPSYLELELTESAAMGKAADFVGLTEKLKGLAVSLAIDDFGTGYSSLSYLKRFALDRLKIDQSFVSDIVHDSDSAAIVVAIIALGHGLGLTVIAEGVETEAQLNLLRVRGCDEMQGYYFSKPLPAAEFEQLLRDERTLSLPATTDLPLKTLLLVDDESSVLAALKRLLRSEGYQILAATSAQEGLELLATHQVGVVMSDQRMPQMTGAEFLAKVRVMYPDTVRIILSGYSDLKSITEVVNRGEIYKFLEKPWDGVALRQTLVEAFRHYEARRTGRGDAV